MSYLRTSNRRIVIDGNIGSGKTTQLKRLSENQGIHVQCEPIHDWPLSLFYEDKQRWAFLLQMTILKSFLENDAVVWERSPESSREVFWKMLMKSGTGVKEEDAIYSYFYDTYSWTPDVHIYIRTEPEECFRRLSSRLQEGDTKIDLDYIKQVHTYYEDYINSKNSVLIIDGNKPPDEIHEEIIRALRDV